MEITRAIYLKVVVDERDWAFHTDDEVIAQMRIQENLPKGIEVEHLGVPPEPTLSTTIHGPLYTQKQIDEFLNR